MSASARQSSAVVGLWNAMEHAFQYDKATVLCLAFSHTGGEKSAHDVARGQRPAERRHGVTLRAR